MTKYQLKNGIKRKWIKSTMDEPLDLSKKRPGPWDNDKLKLIDEKTGELLLECRVGDKYHQLLLETGLNTILEKVLEWNIFWEEEEKNEV